MADEQEITSDECMVAEPKTESDKSSEQESKNEPDVSTAEEGDSDGAGCPITTDFPDHLRCGRKLHAAPKGVDDFPVCLMHSKDRNKQSAPLFVEFWQEFERILADAAEGEAHFEYFIFPQFYLGTRIIKAICHFNLATFTQYSFFSEARFWQDADFSGATFTQYADFHSATFAQLANFSKATFAQGADFVNATFTQYADFSEATFVRAAIFTDAQFQGAASWHSSRFLDQAAFRRTKIEPLAEGTPSAVFALANFSRPGEIVFDDVDLSRALFHNCDVSQVWFTSSVRWAKRKGNRGLAVFEERLLLEEKSQRYGPLDYPAVEQIYHQLKKNYDSRLDYATANEFHFGEMEMKRLAVPTEGRLLCLRRWCHPRLGMAAWYKRASDYGNSYWKAGLLLVVIILLAASLSPSPGVGFKQQETKQTETYTSVWDIRKSWGSNLREEAGLLLDSAIASVDAATFQRGAEYAPAYPWGRLLTIVETLLTSTLFGLFLLAIRRQFRR